MSMTPISGEEHARLIELCRLVEYDMTNRRRDADGFVGERKEVAELVMFVRDTLRGSA